MKILNLYAGIGGNRKLWGDGHDVTAVEYNSEIAAVYQDLFPNDKVIVTDAHQYLLDNRNDYDFIWSSPPCPTHSSIRCCGVQAEQYEAMYPNMDLYQEIILLQNFADKKTKWIIENVIPYYEPLINPTVEMGRHLFWANFKIPKIEASNEKAVMLQKGSDKRYGFDIKDIKIKHDKRKILRNLVDPKLGKHLLKCAENKIITLEAFV